MRLAGGVAVFLVAVTPATADPRDEVLSIAARCNAITDYRAWLDCYYGAAQPMRQILGLPPAPSAQVNLVPASASAVAPIKPPPPAGKEDYVPRQHMADYTFDKQNRFIVTMEDGSKWKQIQEDAVTAHWRAAPASYSASIVPGWFGMMMRVSDGHSYRVRRVP